MTTLELKNILIHRIAEIEDISFQEAINTILDSKPDKKIIMLSDDQRDEIIASKKEIEQALFIKHETFDKEIKEWLNEK